MAGKADTQEEAVEDCTEGLLAEPGLRAAESVPEDIVFIDELPRARREVVCAGSPQAVCGRNRADPEFSRL